MATASDWIGRVGREWADKADALDQLLGPVGEAGIEALGDLEGARVLDLGCGAGATSLALAARGADVVGVDISDDLLERARQRDTQNLVEFVKADAGELVHDAPFDALYSRCGVMFFDDEVAALGHLRSQLKPGAPASIVCWRAADQNDWAHLPLGMAAPVLGEEATRITPPKGPGPFAWSDPAHFEQILTEAGWRDVGWTEIRRQAVMETGDAPDPIGRGVEFAMRIGPLASRLRGIDEVTRAGIRAELAAGLANSLRDGKIVMTTSAWLIRAVA